ncbi:MAG: hypothetical protein AVDCRST_MAG38-1947 [uncultured Solirubrobacteraceae bacterium]|uniref:Tetratricopeptide repeat-like domain-containing protein n=1 Tax=uncultured Solirubrobacteraceae bacterium TaxID=1162706 RepID=A0A6J4RQY5_9ACTN|nr:MAG: hypothetical protein AVDCRST_MAG38-1947 [uncultured Solirubrobacteraceae bacterium]
MLFDLRSPGRRNVIKVVYVTLALLMGGGLVLFGIGGEVSGGVVDAITGSSGGDDGGDRFREREEQALAATKADPRDAAAWGELARARFQLASVGENFDSQTNAFTTAGKAKLQQATAAWEQHVEVARTPDDRLAATMAQAYVELGEPAKAAEAQEIITEARPKAGAFAQLAVYAYAAGQTRRGDLARDRALELTDRDQRDDLRTQLEQARAQAAQPPAAGAEGD